MGRLSAAPWIAVLLSGCAALREEQLLQTTQANIGCEVWVWIEVDHVVLFLLRSADLSAAERSSIDDWIDTAGLRTDKSVHRMSIETRAEWIAPGEADLELAIRRAAAIRDFLVERGIPSDLIATDVLGPRASFSDANADRSRCQGSAEIRLSWEATRADQSSVWR